MAIDLHAFADELVKIAKKEEKKNRMSLGEAAAIGGTGYVTHKAGKATQRGFAHSLLRRETGPGATVEDIAKLKKHMGVEQVPVFHSNNPAGNAAYVPRGGAFRSALGERFGAKYRPVEEKLYQSMGAHPEAVRRAMDSQHGGVLTGSNHGPHIVAHELGHAAGHVKHPKVWSALHKSMLPASAIGTGAALGMSAMADPDSKKSKWAPVVGALGQAPKLIDEGMASWRGYQGMKRSGFNAQQLAHGRGQLLRAFGTYAGGAALPVAGAVGIRQVRKYFKKKRQEAAGQ